MNRLDSLIRWEAAKLAALINLNFSLMGVKDSESGVRRPYDPMPTLDDFSNYFRRF